MRIIVGPLKNKLVEIPNTNIRPTASRIRQNVWNILGNDLTGEVFCDLFSGTGIIALEACSLGAKFTYANELDKRHFFCLKNNFKMVNKEECPIYLSNSHYELFLKQLATQTLPTIIYIDPPYNFDYVQIFKNLKECLKDHKCLLIAEANKKLEDSETIKILKEHKYGNKYIYLINLK